MQRLLGVLLLVAVSSVAHATPTVVNVRDYGALGDGSHDDRPAITAAIAAAGLGGTVYVPNGTYLASPNPGHYWDFSPLAGQTFRGESRDGAVIQMAPGQGASVQLFWLQDAADVSFLSLTLDGNRAAQSVDPHRAGVFAKRSPRLTMRSVTLQHFTGDGVEIYDGSDDPTVYDVLATGNDRNGLTLGGGTNGGTFTHSSFVANAAQQFDSEGNTVSGVTIRDCLFDGLGVSGDYVLTMTGMGADLMSHNWTVTDNVVNGSALMVWITDVVYARNVGTNPTGKPSVRVYRTADRIRIQDNVLTTTGAASFDAGAMIYVTGTGVGQMPAGVVISGNTLTTTASAYGISAICAHDVTILDNTIVGAGARVSWESGVFVRVTKLDAPVASAIIQRNRISNFGSYGVWLAGVGAGATIAAVAIEGNSFSDTSAAPTMTKALYLGDDMNTARLVTTAGNAIAGGTTMLVARPPGGTWQAWGDGARWAVP